MASKREIDRMGIGCEPASATTLAGVKKLGLTGHIACVLTGHVLKDTDAIMKNVPAEQVIERLKSMGITDPNKTYDTDDLAPGKKIIFAASGVTDGALLRGVRFFGSGKRTHSLVMTTESKHIRFVDTVHIEGGPDTVIRF